MLLFFKLCFSHRPFEMQTMLECRIVDVRNNPASWGWARGGACFI